MSKPVQKISVLLGSAALTIFLISALPAAATAHKDHLPRRYSASLGAATPQPLKACSAYSKEHFHGVTAHLPDGTKCLESGEYCSHGPGFAAAYREYGFKCKPDGRLEEV